MFSRFPRLVALAAVSGALLAGSASALGLADLSNQEATRGIRGALSQGADAAINKLGVAGGFLDNPKVRINLPPALEEVAKVMRMVGAGREADDLVAGMNHAAEQAVPEARTLMVGAVKSMSLEDAKGILTGGDDSVTQFFRKKTQSALAEKFLPIVRQTTSRIDLARKYNQFAGQAARFGLVKGDEADIDQYITGRALDGLYQMIAEEEHAIRQDPAAAASSIVARVFGALR